MDKATYVNIRAADTVEDQDRRALIGRPLEKVNLLRSLKVGNAELHDLKADLKETIERGDTGAAAVLEMLTTIAGQNAAGSMRLAPIIAKVRPEALAQVARMIARDRRRRARAAASAVTELRTAKSSDFVGPTRNPPQVSTLFRERSSPVGESHGAARRNAGFARPTLIGSSTAKPSMPSENASAPAGPRHDELAGSGIDHSAAARTRLLDLAQVLPDGAGIQSGSDLEDLPARLEMLATDVEDSVDVFIDLMRIEPIGRLHLERLEMTPVGIERGELVYSIPLAPEETVNISHKEWSSQSEEFEQIVQDYFEEFSEKGVAEKTDLAQSTEAQHRHASAFTLSGSYSYYGASVSVGYNSSSEDQKAQQDSRQQSCSITRKASSRVKREHKQSFRVESVVGREDASVRVISNPSKTDPMRIDYYQLMRKWRTDLYRYGLRMTYDIVIPSPGTDLLQKLDQIRILETQIGRPFGISLQPSDIDRDNWADIAAEWNAKVDTPPPAEETLNRHAEIGWRSDDDANRTLVEAMDFVVSPDYTISSGEFHAILTRYSDSRFDVLGDPEQPVVDTAWYNSTLSHLYGGSGDLAVVYEHSNVATGSVQFSLALRLTTEAFERWQYEAWTTIRDAAEQAYYASLQLLTERRDRMLDELKDWDALTLRRLEREEIMKGVLRWLFGPDFEIPPAEIEGFFEPVGDNLSVGAPPPQPVEDAGDSAILATGLGALVATRGPIVGSGVVVTDGGEVVLGNGNGSSDSDGHHPMEPVGPPPLEAILPTEENWERVIQYGEMIKFLHHAIEWESVLYFTYPYFWDSPANWDFKRFLRHPDAIHREFLRAGSARVVLTIRPGYEVDFVRFIETGAMGENHPYLTIAQEIQAYAQTNYPGIPPANPEDSDNESEVEGRERGVLIGRWYEYTPTSALDLSIDTPLDHMA
jgi:hypothetical protein